MRLTANVDIDAPIAAVWRCIDEPELIVRWVEGAVSHRYITEPSGTSRVGQKFAQSVRQGPKVRAFEGTLIACDRPTHFAFTIPSPAYSSEAHFRLREIAAARTHVDYSIDVILHSLKARIAAALLRVPLAFFVPRQMRRLKALAETVAKEAK